MAVTGEPHGKIYLIKIKEWFTDQFIKDLVVEINHQKENIYFIQVKILC